MRVTARIQAHPARSHLWSDLIAALAPLETKVSVHSSDPPNPWEGYKQALKDGIGSGASHVLVIQEDTIVCRNFADALGRIAEANPDDPVCLFLSWLPSPTSRYALEALKKGEHYIQFQPAGFCPVVAILWPVSAARDFLHWAESGVRLPGHNVRGGPASDDAILDRWVQKRKVRIWIALPSLVEHPDTVASVKGRQNALWGKDRGRIALHFIGEEDPLEVDWAH